MTRGILYTLLLLPPYLLLCLVRPLLPADHMMKHLSLLEFTRGATDTAVFYGVIFWLCLLFGGLSWFLLASR